jgi:predicted acylesterase/phospholipase RssA
MAAKVRLALTISGAVSLGSFEGGVLAALLNGIRPLCQGEDPVAAIDAIGGASAGSMTGLLAARCLIGGFDPVAAMERAWVSGDSIQQLLHNHGDSPLSATKLRQLAEVVFGDEQRKVGGAQSERLRLVMMLGCLRGLEYTARQPGQPGVDATTFVDLATFDIDPTWTSADFLQPVAASPADIAIASGANAFAFPPQLLNRNNAAADYQARGLQLPPGGYLWYTDGGTVDNEPLGHTLDVANALDSERVDGAHRVHILIHPDPTGGMTGTAWADRGEQPTWASTLLRADHMQRTQSLYDDLRTVVKTNTRIKWLGQVVEALNGVIDDLPADQQEQFDAAISKVLGDIGSDLGELPGVHTALNSSGDFDLASKVSLAVRTAAGVSDKRPVGVEVISPLALAERENVPVARLLAGAVLGHFGGFFDENLRRSDFDLGYQCGVEWISDGLQRCGLAPADADRAHAAACDGYTPLGLWKQWGDTSLSYIAMHHPLAMAALVGQLGRVSSRDMFVMHHRNAKGQ